jgi:hypothetical protein
MPLKVNARSARCLVRSNSARLDRIHPLEAMLVGLGHLDQYERLVTHEKIAQLPHP